MERKATEDEARILICGLMTSLKVAELLGKIRDFDYCTFRHSLLVLVNKGLYEKNMSISLTQNMWNNFVKYSGFLNGLLYSAAVIFMFYLMALYIGNAIAMAALFAFFPFIAFLSITDKGTFSNWLKQVIGTIMVPVIDSVLFVVPAYLCGLNGMFGSIICLISCLFIVPARQALKQALGFGGAGFGEAAGLGALRMMGKATTAALAGGAAALKGGSELARGLKDSSDARKEMRDKAQSEIADDEEKAKLEEAMAKSSSDMNHNTALKEDGFKPNEQKKPAEVDADNIKPGTEGPGENPPERSSDESKLTGDEAIPKPGEPPITDYDGENPPQSLGGGDVDVTGTESDTNPEIVQSDTPPIQTDGATASAELTSGDANINLNDDNARIQNLEDMSRAQDEIQAQENEISALDNTDRAIAAQDEARRNEINDIEQSLAAEKAQYLKNNPDAKQSDLNKAFFRKDQQAKIDIANKKAFMGTLTDDKGNVVATSAGVAKKRNEANAKIREQRNVQQNARELEGRFAEADKLNGGSGKSFSDPNEFAMQQNQNEVLRSMANHRNFETPEINAALTHADKSQLYKDRALQKKQDLAKELQKSYKQDRQAIARAAVSGAGGLARGVGAAVGGGLAVMTGEAGVQMGAQVGRAAGNLVGSAGDFAVNSVQYGQAYVQNGDHATKKWSKNEVKAVNAGIKESTYMSKARTSENSAEIHSEKAQMYKEKANNSQNSAQKRVYNDLSKMYDKTSTRDSDRAHDYTEKGIKKGEKQEQFREKASNIYNKQYLKEHRGDVVSQLPNSQNPTMLKGTTPLKRETVAYDPTKLRHIVQDGYKQPKTMDIQIDERKEEPIVNPEHERAKEVEKMYDEQNRKQQGGKK